MVVACVHNRCVRVVTSRRDIENVVVETMQERWQREASERPSTSLRLSHGILDCRTRHHVGLLRRRMNESHQEITRSVDAESSEHQFVRARVTGRVRANERVPTIDARRSAGRRGQRTPKAGQSVVTLCPKRSESIHSSLADGNVRRRFGGTVNGGDRRGGNAPNNRSVTSAI